ncbi:MAG: aminopeptidase N [Betaproteobacteria bacterium]
MQEDNPSQIVLRQDYQASAFFIDQVDLTFDLDATKTRVLNKMQVRRNPDTPTQALRLHGEELNLARVLVNGQGTSFKLEDNSLVLENLPEGHDVFELEIFTTCNPSKNTKLMGLYVSQDSFFTQCEAEGFRRITYFLDRPDVMSSYTVLMKADQKLYPVLLSNGNLVDSGPLEDGRHFAKWSDPHKKPCYLFALVAGQLVCREQRITTQKGSEHLLQIYVRPGDLDKTEHAMNSLMASIAWDETRFNLSLDLERFMIVATSDFNMGAMENKGLNIFNTKFVLANSQTATDSDFENIESVVAHEYFHNWTGNRVTCRDWFQLSLKEGLTVFRDQEFSQDIAHHPSARAVKRIEDVRLLRTVQFAEDAGPMSHPVRPDQYLEINNFYTVTIYEKGAEVVRMMQTLVGKEGFKAGMALYFKRHDGQAVTCDDFASAVADANPQSALKEHLEIFKRWYSQAGTPLLRVHGEYDEVQLRYTLHLNQMPPSNHSNNEPYLIPVEVGLLNSQGQETHATQLLVLHESSASYVFENVSSRPIASVLRQFSAPVVLEQPLSQSDLLTLLAFDSDPFNQWDAAQKICLQAALEAYQQKLSGNLEFSDPISAELMAGLRQILRNPDLDNAFKELVLTLPSESYIAEQLTVVDPALIHQVREDMKSQIARDLFEDWQWIYHNNQLLGAYKPEPFDMGQRAITSMALQYLCLQAVQSGDKLWPGITYQKFKDAHNMTERFAAMGALVNAGHELGDKALELFHSMFSNEALVLDKWFALQASACERQTPVLTKVKQLTQHADFHIKNPNRARSLIFSYCMSNPGAFHKADASGYVFWAEKVLEIDAFNPQVAARLARGLDRYRKLAQPYQNAAHEAIKRVAAKADLSNDVREVISRALGDAS